jgi:hypothetical protein
MIWAWVIFLSKPAQVVKWLKAIREDFYEHISGGNIDERAVFLVYSSGGHRDSKRAVLGCAK